MKIQNILIDEFKLKPYQVENTIKLIDEGNTIPFIARYRKEMTGDLKDTILREFNDRLQYLKNLEDRQNEILRLIDEQGKLTEELKSDILKAVTLQRLEDLYRPYRPKRRTRATMAKEKGLEGLANFIFSQSSKENSIEEEVAKYIDVDKGVLNEEDALNGAMDIIAEKISENAGYRDTLRKITINKGNIQTESIEKEKESEYEMYYDFKEKIKTIPNHRILAINRGEKEKVLKVKIIVADEEILSILETKIITNKSLETSKYLELSLKDSYKRLMFPSMEREIRSNLTEKAEKEAIDVFALNLKPLLMQPPIMGQAIMGIDPGYRTGCKIAVIDETGKLLHYTTIYPTEPQNKIKESKQVIKENIDSYNVDIIAIGNGTASRETEMLVADSLKEIERDISYTIVSEAGASVYSASEVGQQEFPDIDVSIRGAVSIARRLQDPLAELVKIEPKHIGVGQYQHDLNQSRLDESLKGVVEDCVNTVGVDLNTASISLLKYVSGLSNKVAQNMIKYRGEVGRFKNRKELLDIKGLGPKTFTQCAGFLRIPGGNNVLDNTAVHPESYDVAQNLIAKDFDNHNIKELSQELNVGSLTLKDIISELKRPGRDPRDEMPKVIFRKDVLKMEDLKEDMVLKGTVRNVVDFGAFVDIGVKQDGLIHISELSNRYIKHPKELVKVGDVIKVKIIGIDINKGRISLSLKDI